MVFTPFAIKNVELKNRWIMLAMHTGFAEGTALKGITPIMKKEPRAVRLRLPAFWQSTKQVH